MEDNIPEYLESAGTFLQYYSWIFRESNTEFVQRGILEHMPKEWISALNRLSNEDINLLPFGHISEQFPKDLKCFLKKTIDLKVPIFSNTIPNSESHQRLKGMSPKKSHEIIRLGKTIKDRCESLDVLVDLGSGLGYLSEYLYEEHSFRVLGLESDESRVKSAQERQTKMHKSSTDSVKYRPHFIEETSMDFILRTIEDEFQISNPKIGLVGLHACGDLTITALKLTASYEAHVKALVIMPCCYHRMSLINEFQFRNFPLSEALRKLIDAANVPPQRSPFHRPFLRLACQQSVKHWSKMSQEEHHRHGHGMFVRSLVGAMANISGESNGIIIRRTSKFNVHSQNTSISFDDLCSEFGLFSSASTVVDQIPWTEEHFRRYTTFADKFRDQEVEGGVLAEFLTGLQTLIQVICENVVLLDRVQYFRERAALRDTGESSLGCWVEKITDDNLSPRCYALIVGEK